VWRGRMFSGGYGEIRQSRELTSQMFPNEMKARTRR
jgi:hypothetical protein